MMQNSMDIEELKREQMYEYFKDLSNEHIEEIIKEINDSEEDQYYENLKIVLERIENERLREQFYWQLYYLIDEEDNFTELGEYYESLYTHHYIKALKLFFSLSDSLIEKNKVFTKNEKAKEYLKHFQYFVNRKR